MTHTYRDYNLFSDLGVAIETELTPIVFEGETFVLAVTKNVAAQKKTICFMSPWSKNRVFRELTSELLVKNELKKRRIFWKATRILLITQRLSQYGTSLVR
ncbi:hypothetical protein AUO94_07890 [Planococcus kocurii]|uniref:Uncharacterized protein n=1 Tax=Planococcus kocurii TaxID=1374 RepID=A0ABM5WW69_9BACL|nr:hypothetical protein AUO94_07890 [Planococcus kocurii]